MVGGSAIQYQSAVVLLQGSDSTIRAKSLLRTELHEGFNLGSCNGCFTKTICHVIKLKNKDAEFFFDIIDSAHFTEIKVYPFLNQMKLSLIRTQGILLLQRDKRHGWRRAAALCPRRRL